MHRTARVVRHVLQRCLWVPWLLLMLGLAGCGGAGYAKAQAAPGGYRGDGAMAPQAAAAGEATVATADYEREESDEKAGGMPAPAPPPSPAADGRPAAKRTAALEEPPRKTESPQSQPVAGSTAPAQPKQMADVLPLTQMLIYTAQITMAVYEVEKALALVETTGRDSGGFLARRTDREIVIRVPTEKFFEVLKKLEGMGDLLHKNVQVEDVTEQYLDVALRLKNARDVRDRMAQLLAQAKTVEESLKVEQQLERLSAEIERLEGRLKYLRDRVRFSTITVSFQPMQVSDLQRDKVFRLPFPWLQQLGLGRLLNLQ